jgi:hypothetical protein
MENKERTGGVYEDFFDGQLASILTTAIISSRILTESCWEDSQRNLGSNCLLGFILIALLCRKARYNSYFVTSPLPNL